jgi:site-specific DNA recombinase
VTRAKPRRCGIYTRKSSEEGLEQDFNSLHAQREACEAYVRSQHGEGWSLVKTAYDDGGFSGATMERPGLQRLLADIRAAKADTVVVYKVDRLTRSLTDFAKMVELFDSHGVSFVSVTQQFNTTTSMGRLTLNVLLSFAQFEREVTGERIRDKIAASKKKGMWMGGFVPLGYDAKDRSLVIHEAEAKTVRAVFRLYLKHGNVRRVKNEADQLDLATKLRPAEDGRMRGGRPLSRGYIYKLLGNPIYAGRIAHKGTSYPAPHTPIIDAKTWDAVQARLAGNAHEHYTGARAAEPSLLAGFLHDERGNRLSPSHAVKKGVRYRYYVSQALLQHREDDAGSIVRIPAREIEDLVTARIRIFLKDPGKLIDELAESLTPRDRNRLLANANKRADQWPQMNASARRAFILSVVSGVAVSEHEIRLVLRRGRLRNSLLDDASPESVATVDPDLAKITAPRDEFTVCIPARLKRCSGEVRLVIPPGHAKELRLRPNSPLIRALARAHTWKDQLLSGQIPSVCAIANEEGVTERYVSRILRLAFLAPDIVDAILSGYQPADLELERLLTGIPVGWDEQRRAYGFATGA